MNEFLNPANQAVCNYLKIDLHTILHDDPAIKISTLEIRLENI